VYQQQRQAESQQDGEKSIAEKLQTDGCLHWKEKNKHFKYL